MPEADTIVVLGCTVSPTGAPSAALSRRIELGARAFHEGMVSRVIASGGRRWGRHVEAVVMQRELVERGVPRHSIHLELCSLSTVENCVYTAEILRGLHQGSSVVVATCAWHFPRASRSFRSLGVRAVSPPAEWLDTPPPSALRRLREQVNGVVDWCMMPRGRHG